MTLIAKCIHDIPATSYCLACEESDSPNRLEAHETLRLPTNERLLMDCEMHLIEVIAILSGKQFERNPNGLILNKSMQLLHRLQNS